MPRVGGKEYPYTKAGMAAAKKAAGKKTAAGKRQSKEGVKSNRIQSKGYTFEPTYSDGQLGGTVMPFKTSDALQRSKRTKQSSTGAMKSRMNARKKGAR